MQKKLIALAVAGLVSGAAFAQTNVTVYGVVDVGYQYNKSEDNKFSGIESGEMSGSRIGFRTTEALGNGLSAIAQAEFGFKADTNSGLNTVRNAWVGLKHDQIGAFTAGRQNRVAYDWIAKGYASDITVVYPSNTLASNFTQLHSSDRVDNSVKYASPVWGGFEVRTVYGFGEKVSSGLKNTPARVEQDTSDAGKFTLGGAYKNGPVDLALIYAQTSRTMRLSVTTASRAGASVVRSTSRSSRSSVSTSRKRTRPRSVNTTSTNGRLALAFRLPRPARLSSSTFA